MSWYTTSPALLSKTCSERILTIVFVLAHSLLFLSSFCQFLEVVASQFYLIDKRSIYTFLTLVKLNKIIVFSCQIAWLFDPDFWSLRLSINRFKLFSEVPNFLKHLIWNEFWFIMLLLVIWILSFILLYCPVWWCAFSFHLSKILAIWEGFFTSLSASDDWHYRYC